MTTTSGNSIGCGRRPRHQGFTLVELMIALTLGLVVTAAIGYVFLSSKRSLNYGQGMARLQENQRSSLIILNTVLRQAGYVYDTFTYTSPSMAFPGPPYAVFGGSATSGLSSTFVGSNSNVSTAGDFIEIAFVGDDDGTGTTGSMRNCLGTLVKRSEISLNVFYVNKAANEKVPSLYCSAEQVVLGSPSTVSGTAPPPQPLIYGVSSLTVTYGIDSSLPPDRAVDYYATTSQMSSTLWPKVMSLGLRLQTQSTDLVDSVSSGPVTTGGNNTLTGSTASGFYLQRPLTQTVVIRNKLQ